MWQDSFDLTKEVYSLTEHLPRHEQFGLSSQLRRCAVSVPSNIAEGQQRNNAKENRQFLGIARGSAAEPSTQLLLAQEIYKLEAKEIINEVEAIQKMLYALMQKL